MDVSCSRISESSVCHPRTDDVRIHARNKFAAKCGFVNNGVLEALCGLVVSKYTSNEVGDASLEMQASADEGVREIDTVHFIEVCGKLESGSAQVSDLEHTKSDIINTGQRRIRCPMRES